MAFQRRCEPNAACYFVTVTEYDPVSELASLSVARTVMVCAPAASEAVFSGYVNPTFGHPGRPA